MFWLSDFLLVSLSLSHSIRPFVCQSARLSVCMIVVRLYDCCPSIWLFCPSLHPYVRLSNSSYTCLSFVFFVFLSVCLFIHLPVHFFCLFVCFSVCQFVCPSVCLPFHLTFTPSILLSVYSSVCLSLHPSIHPSSATIEGREKNKRKFEILGNFFVCFNKFKSSKFYFIKVVTNKLYTMKHTHLDSSSINRTTYVTTYFKLNF